MKKFKKAKLILTSIAFGLVLIGFVLPSKWRIERSIVIQAPPEKIYPLIANFKTGWSHWSVFDNEDPTIQYTYMEKDEGVGAARSWTSKKMGNGTQRIVKADLSSVEFELEMTQNHFLLHGIFAFEPMNGSTKVTWTDYGEVDSNPAHRVMAVLMDTMMGSTFERSLSLLKKKAEESVQ